MRTVGEILKKARLEQKLTFEDVEKNIRIRKKFLKALEENTWNKLPPLPYIKGFIKNYSSFLKLNPNEMVAIFRRQFSRHERIGLLPNGVTSPLNEPLFRITPQKIVLFVVLSSIIIFFSYLFFQYRSFTGPPNLTVTKPAEGEIIVSENVQISGKTDPDAVLSINNQKIALSENGEFSINLNLPPDTHKIIIEATSKYGKKKAVSRTIQVQSSQ